MVGPFRRVHPAVLPCLLLCLLLLVLEGEGVDRNKFKKCNEISFCPRHRNLQKGVLDYKLVGKSYELKGSRWSAKVFESKTRTFYSLEVVRYEGNVVRLLVDEVGGLKPRYRVTDSLLELKEVDFESFDEEKMTLKLNDANKIVIQPEEFKFDFFVGETVAMSTNQKGLFYFEHLREKPVEGGGAADGGLLNVEDPSNPTQMGHVAKKQHVEIDGISFENAWEQSFGGSTDRPKYGPQSVGMDVTFNVDEIYGIPEHTTRFALESTIGSNAIYNEPYRLYNLDVFEYETETPMALYGSVPFLIGHSSNLSVGFLWLNGAETWIDVEHQSQGGGFFWSSGEKRHSIDTHWFSESGIVDAFFLFGPSPKDVWGQYASLVGTQELPPLFAIAYHQCRWNYNDEQDVAEVNQKFEELNIPYDVIWLDIEHTNGKRYFTWDSKHFPTPIKMINGVARYGRKMVTIVDPHIKRDSGYHVHSLAEGDKVYIKDGDGSNDYSGFCWPGSSSWIDFMSPEIRSWWAKRFEFDQYDGSTPDLFTWNDMNEPSVFSGPEVTMDKNAIHYQGWEHRDVHNVYGMLMHRATSEGLVLRNPGANKRPFVLSRAFYAGSQRWGAIWTGDNTADWKHLAIAQPMLLSLGVAGITFSGADVGGFFGNPSPELLLRWYQAGAYQPFFRAHAHHDTKRREPWVHGDPWTNRIRDAIITRYSILPYLYTTFYQSYLSGVPILRPLWAEFPSDTSTFKTEDTFLLGPSLLVKPVTSEGQTSIDVSFPGISSQYWYHTSTFEKYNGGSQVNVAAPIDYLPVFQRGGSIIPRKTRLRRSSTQTLGDPITLVIALNDKGEASGELYIDDGESFDYKTGSYTYTSLTYTPISTTEAVLKPSNTLGKGSSVNNRVEKIIILGTQKPTTVTVKPTSSESSQNTLHFDYVGGSETLTVKNPNVLLSSSSWEVLFKF